MLQIHETYVDVGNDVIFGESGWYEPHTDARRRLFHSLQEEFGRCISKVYRDELQVNGRMVAVSIGWVFQKRDKYTDTKEVYLREVWVSVREEQP